MRTSRLAPLATALLLVSGGAAAQPIPFDIEAGYRWLDVTGNRDMYRSQLNEREGLILRSFTLSTTDAFGTSDLIDHFRVDASDLGAGPAGLLRVEGGQSGKWALHLSYNRLENFSALPAFANPLLNDGIIPGQHTFDRVRNTFAVELEVLPGGAITPIVGYTRDRFTGPGRTTYTVGGDEFRLDSARSDSDQEFHAGAAFHAGPVSGQVIQGWRKFKGEESLTLVPGAGAGNGSGTILGTPVSLDDLTRSSTTEGNTPVTTAWVAAQVVPRVKVVGSYLRANAESDSGDQEDLSGSLVSFPLARFFQGLSESISSRAKNTQWRWGARVDANVATGVDLTAGYTRQHRELDGEALINTLYFGTLTFSGLDPKDILKVLEAKTALERTEKVFNAGASVRPIGPLTVRVGWTQTDQDVTVTPDPSEIVIPGGQGGTFDRRIRTLDAGATYTQKGLTLGADLQRARADEPVVRVDFLRRDRYRLRAAYSLGETLRVSATAQQVDTSNDRDGIGASARIRQYGVHVEGTPWKPLRLHLSLGKFQADSTALIRRPYDFGVESSIHAENASSYEGGATLSLSPFTLDGSWGRFENKGTLPFRIERVRFRGDLELTKQVGLVAEWARDNYEEKLPSHPGDYDANRYGLYVRWKP